LSLPPFAGGNIYLLSTNIAGYSGQEHILTSILSEKTEYIHSNPASKNWRLVKNRADYKYSSACFYDNGKVPIIPITDVNKWLMI
jgi:hypothetical protein